MVSNVKDFLWVVSKIKPLKGIVSQVKPFLRGGFKSKMLWGLIWFKSETLLYADFKSKAYQGTVFKSKTIPLGCF